MSLMAEEIRQTPGAIERLLTEGSHSFRATAEAITAADPRWICIVARGTSDHAAVYARYLLESRLGVPVSLAAPSLVGVYRTRTRWEDAMVLSISQSGRSPDLVGVVKTAKEAGALTVAITNDPKSPLAAASHHVVDCRAGAERSVAATKSYVTALVAVASLVDALRPIDQLPLTAVPATVAAAIAAAESWVEDTEIVEAFASAPGALVVGRGFNLATALEIALKLIETGRRFALGYSAADVEHGPLVLAAQGTPVLILESPGPARAHLASLARRVTAAGADAWMVDMGGRDARESHRLSLPGRVPEELSPIPMVVPGQILAEAVSRRLRFDPDAPPGLSKVTLTL